MVTPIAVKLTSAETLISSRKDAAVDRSPRSVCYGGVI